GDPGHADPRMPQTLGDQVGGCVAFGGRVCRKHQLPYAAAPHARLERSNAQLLGTDAVNRRECAAQHVVAPGKAAAALDGLEVGGLLDDAQECRVACGIATDRAWGGGSQVEALLA